MASIVEILGVSSFGKSIILVLVSATATGIFGLLIVLIQTHAEKGLHERMDKIEDRVTEAKQEVIAETAKTITETAAQTNNEETK